eukprot:TRINITY_DN131_c0_g2_i1.p1 TRINITY_DN131_c0_g2~~TRINITY_DN131_c0_g2_i1.p1  ORF type:complete len:982 (+),score=422.82 TRINITY_DN131_c0_g2_i1:165-3110(+)
MESSDEVNDPQVPSDTEPIAQDAAADITNEDLENSPAPKSPEPSEPVAAPASPYEVPLLPASLDDVPSSYEVTDAYRVLQQLAAVRAVNPQQMERWIEKLDNLVKGLNRAYEHEQKLLQKVQTLKTEQNNQKDMLKKAGTESFENNAEIRMLKKDLQKKQTEVKLCEERDEALDLEIMHEEQAKTELESLIEEERRRKMKELEPKIQALKASNAEAKEEINNQRLLLERQERERNELYDRIRTTEQEITDMNSEATRVKQELRSKSDPDKFRKQADVVQNAIKTVNVELEKMGNYVIELDTSATNQAKKKDDGMRISMELAMQLDKYRNQIESKERECNKVLKDAEIEKQKHQQFLEERQMAEMETKRLSIMIRRKNEEMLGVERDTNNALKSVRRAKVALELATKFIPALEARIAETKREVEREDGMAKKMREKLDETRADRDVMILNLLRQEDFESGKGKQLKQVYDEIAEMEAEVDSLVKSENMLQRQISDLSLDRDFKRMENMKLQAQLERGHEELQMKALAIADLDKIHNTTQGDLRHYESLYEVVKNERNKYVNMLQSAELLGSELTEKIKVVQNEIDILLSGSSIRDKALTAKALQFQNLCGKRDLTRAEVNKSTFMYHQKEEIQEQTLSEIRKLNSIIKRAEADLYIQRRKYESELLIRNNVGMQLIDANEETSLLHMKAHQQEGILRTGQIELQKRQEEMRILELHYSEVARQIGALRKQDPLIPKLTEERDQLTKLLKAAKKECRKLSRDLESPENTERWRSLEGPSPDNTELGSKIADLESKIDKKKEELAKKQAMLMQADTLVQRLEQKMSEDHQKGSNLAVQINDYKARVKEVNKKVTALIGESAVIKGSLEVKRNQRDELVNRLEFGRQNLERGFAPTEEIEHAWRRHVARKNQRPVAVDDDEPPAPDPRVNMYIPDNDLLGLPRPYGRFSPFMPSVAGSTMRHIRKPANTVLVLRPGSGGSMGTVN